MRALVLLLMAVFAVHSTVGQGADCASATNLAPLAACTPANYTTVGLENWFSFTATSEFVNIQVTTNDAGVDAPHVHGLTLLSGSCGNLSEMDHDELAHKVGTTKLAIDLNSSGLTIGNTYYVKLSRSPFSDACNMVNCDASGPAPFTLCVQEVDIFIPPDAELGLTSREFEMNKGQLRSTDGTPTDNVKFYTIGGEPKIFAAKNGIAFAFYEDAATAGTQNIHRVDFTLVGATAGTPMYHLDVTRGHSNYFLENSDRGIRLNKSFKRLVYKDVYPHIDLHLYSNLKGVKMYFVVGPDGNPDDIELKFNGASSTNATGAGGLLIETQIKNLEFERAHVYRVNPIGNTVPMPSSGNFISAGIDEYAINVQNYPQNQTLVIAIDEGHVAAPPSNIPPCWSTYFGGDARDEVTAVDVDAAGEQYVAGNSESSNFPALGGFSSNPIAAPDWIIGSFDVSHLRNWVTYYGGGQNEEAYDVRENGGSVFTCGWTSSPNMPVDASGSEFLQANNNSLTGDGFILELDKVNGFSEWATYFGGLEGDRAVALEFNSVGDLYVVGRGANDNNPNPIFPVLPLAGAYNQLSSDGTDGWIARFNSNNEQLWTTFFGGDGTDNINSIAFDSGDNMILSGITSSTNLPIIDAAGSADYHDGTLNGSRDYFVVTFTNNQRTWGTYLGGSGDEGSIFGAPAGENRVAVHPQTGAIYVVGTTYSNDFPVINSNPASSFYDDINSSSEGFVFRLNGSSLAREFSSYIGGNGHTEVSSVVCANGPLGSVFIGGSTGDNAMPILAATNSYDQPNIEGTDNLTADGIIIALDASNNQQWGTYFGGFTGGGDGDYIRDLALIDGFLYAVGWTRAMGGVGVAPFPLEDAGGFFQGIFQGGTQDGFITKFCVNDVLTTNDLQSSEDASVIVYPNPTLTDISIVLEDLDGDVKSIEIIDLTGRIVFIDNQLAASGVFNIDVTTLAQGSYLIKVQTQDQTYIGRFEKQ